MKKNKGFTLVEIIIALVIISVLAVIIGFSINNIVKKTKEREYERYVDMIKSSTSTYISLNREIIEDLYTNKAYVYITVEELIKSGLLDEGLKDPYTGETPESTNDVVKVRLDGITGGIQIDYPPYKKLNPDDPNYDPNNPGYDPNNSDERNPIPGDREEVTLRVFADVLDDEGMFNCMNGAGTYKLAIAKEDGTLIHLADSAGNLNGTIISKYDINCKIPKEFTETTGGKDAISNGSVYRTFKNYKVKEGTFNVEYSWKSEDGRVQKVTRLISVKGKKLDVKFDANRKTDTGALSVDHIVVVNGAQYGTLATTTRSNHIFGGWYYENNLILNNTTVTATESHTLKAKWMKLPTLTIQGYNKSGATMNASNGYVYKDVATVTFYGPEDNNDTIYYYVKSGSSAVVNVSAYACGTGSIPGTCTSSGVTTISANTWYKVGSGTTNTTSVVTVSYEEHRDTNVTLETYVINAKNYNGAGNSIQIRKIDRVAPATCQVNPSGTLGNNGYYVSNMTFTATGTDAASKVASQTVDISSITSDTKGTTVTATIVDYAGNSTTCSNTYKMDKTAPSCTSSGGYAWTSGNVTLIGTCSDGTSECVENISKLYNTEGHWTNQSPGRVYDKAGNYTDCPANQTVGIDRTSPSCTSSGGSDVWTNGSRTLTGTCAGGSGAPCTGNATKTISTETNSTTQSPGRVFDEAGNYTDCPANQTVKIDKTPPAKTTVSLNGYGSGTWTNGNVTQSASSSDALSGISYYQYTHDKTSIATFSNPWTITWEGAWNFYVRAVDNAGNAGEWSDVYTLRIDKTAPSCTSSGGSEAWTNDGRTLLGTCADTGGSGCAGNVSWLINWEGSWTNLSPGTVYDTAGNSVKCPANQTVKVDKTVPATPTVTYNGGANTCSWKNNYNLTVTSSDSASGVYIFQVDHNNDGVADAEYAQGTNSWTWTPANGYDTHNDRYRVKDYAGNYSGWSAAQHIHMTSCTFTVTYNANGGSGAPATESHVCYNSYTLSSTAPTRTGYTFQGWATSATALTAQYQPGASYTGTGNLSLFAVWKVNTYTCSAGYYLKGDSVTCSQCEAGSYCPGGSYNYSSSVQGKSGCPTNYGNSAAGSTQQSDCYLTTTAGKWVYTAKSNQQTCGDGGYCPGGSAIYYGQTGGRNRCPTGYGYAPSGSDEVSDCYLNTSAGKYVASANAAQTTCTEGGFCPGRVLVHYGSTGGRTVCPTYYASSADGSTQQSDCYLTTTVGKWVYTAKTNEQTCGNGGYCPGGSTIYYGQTGGRNSCPTGYGNAPSGSDEASDCYKIVKVSYDANGGSGSTTASSCNAYYNNSSCNITLNSNGFTAPSGKEFDGWGTGTSAVTHNAGMAYSFSSDTTLYANWKSSYNCPIGRLVGDKCVTSKECRDVDVCVKWTDPYWEQALDSYCDFDCSYSSDLSKSECWLMATGYQCHHYFWTRKCLEYAPQYMCYCPSGGWDEYSSSECYKYAK